MSTVSVISPKKLIEVALPLDAINTACAREKSIRHGHPSTLHLWWARRPLAAARAVIFGQLVHDPEDLWRTQNPGVEPKPQNKSAWTRERVRLFKIIEDLVLWENTTNEVVLEAARAEIRRSWKISCELNKDHPQAAELFNPAKMPGLHDPFAGGGAIPLEAQRLGLEAYASDLNPVAVLINKAMIEIPPRFAGRAPVHPDAKSTLGRWHGAGGVAEDVRRYGQWIRDEAAKRVGHLYPKVKITTDMTKDRPDLEPYVGREVNVIAWLWARTVRSPSPAFGHVDVPLASSFILSSGEGKEAYVVPEVDRNDYQFRVLMGSPPPEASGGTKAARGANFRCLMSGAPLDPKYIRAEAVAGRMGARLMGIVADGARGRLYLPPVESQQSVAMSAEVGSAADPIDVPIANDPRPMTCLLYGLRSFRDLFSARQLVTLTTIGSLIEEVRARIVADATASGWDASVTPLAAGGSGTKAYADAVCLYLGFGLGKLADYNSTLCSWIAGGQTMRNTYGRQALPMIWDFAEANPLGNATGSYTSALSQGARVLDEFEVPRVSGSAVQADAQSQEISAGRFVSTDPPYYDNIGYADLSDFFYVWLRQSLRGVFPELTATISVPKAEELVAATYRQGSKEAAEDFFLDGMTHAMRRISSQAHPAAPVTIYYAFKQSDTSDDLTNSTGWETFLQAVLLAGFSLVGTWPLRTELGNRMRSTGFNALASSVVLVCRPRELQAGTISRRQFVRMLNETLPTALDAMTRESEGLHSPVAPVDLSQAIIGPGMAIFSRYKAVLEADGTPMSVRTALQLINRFLAEDDFDADTQFCLHWFEQHGWDAGKFGEADTLARAKGTSVDGVKNAGVVEAGGGSVRLLRWKEYPTNWDPRADSRLPVWEALHHMIRVYQTEGDSGAATVLAAVARMAEPARQLAYRLYTLCERKGWAEDARAYNAVVAGWGAIEQAAAKVAKPAERSLFEPEEVS